MPDAMIATLVLHAVDAVRTALNRSGAETGPGAFAAAQRIATERISNDYWLGQHDFESGWARVMRDGGRDIASEGLLSRYAAEDRFAEAVAVFALMTNSDLEEARHWMVRLDTEPFLTVAKAAGLGVATVQSLLRSGPWKYRLDHADRATALARYQTLTAAEAGAMLARRPKIADLVG
jgi:hypothetical protein